METKESTNEMEQEKVAAQDSTTAIDAGTTEEPQTADIADETSKEESKVEEVETVEATDNSTEETNDETTIVEEKAEPIVEEEEPKNEEVANTSEESSEAVTDEVVEEATKEELTEEKNTGEDTEVETQDTVDEEEIDPETDYTNHSLEALVDALVNLVKIEDITKIKNNVGNIKAQYFKKIKQLKDELLEKFISDGGIKEEYEAVSFDYEVQYNAALSLYKEKRRKYIENLEKEKAENLKKKEDLLESLRQMINSNESLSKIYNEFKELQSNWREIGLVTQNQVSSLWYNYNLLVE
jgi:hypothetical protein